MYMYIYIFIDVYIYMHISETKAFAPWPRCPSPCRRWRGPRQLLHKIINLLIELVIANNKLTSLWGI